MRLIYAAFAAFLVVTAEAQAWTKRKGKSNKVIDQEDAEPDPSLYGNFAAMNELATKEPAAKKVRKSRRDPRAAPDMEALMSQMAGGGMAEMMNQMAGGGMAEMLKGLGGGDMAEMLKGLGGGDMAGMAEMLKGIGGGEGLEAMMKGLEGQDMGALMQQGMGMWKQMLDSPDMQAVLSNPDQMREMMLPFVEMMGGDMAKLEEVLADPEKLKSSMNEGLETMTELISNPTKMKEVADTMLQSLDPATRSKVERLASGDDAVMAELLADIDPDGALKELVAGLTDPAKLADPAFLAQVQQQLRGNGDVAAFAEKFLAENPDMAAELSGAGVNLGALGRGAEL